MYMFSQSTSLDSRDQHNIAKQRSLNKKLQLIKKKKLALVLFWDHHERTVTFRKPLYILVSANFLTPPSVTRPLTPNAAAAANLLQLCATLCDPIDGSPPGSPVPGILQARTLESVAISFSNA